MKQASGQYTSVNQSESRQVTVTYSPPPYPGQDPAPGQSGEPEGATKAWNQPTVSPGVYPPAPRVFIYIYIYKFSFHDPKWNLVLLRPTYIEIDDSTSARTSFGWTQTGNAGRRRRGRSFIRWPKLCCTAGPAGGSADGCGIAAAADRSKRSSQAKQLLHYRYEIVNHVWIGRIHHLPPSRLFAESLWPIKST